MTGLEELIRRGYLPHSDQGSRSLRPEPYGHFGRLSIGDTTFNTLQRFLNIKPQAANLFVPTIYAKPRNVLQTKPDELIVKGRSVITVVEHKRPNQLARERSRRGALEQLYLYVLIADAKLGFLTDGSSRFWIHNLAPNRRDEMKIIIEDGRYCSRAQSPEAIAEIAATLNAQTDELAITPAFDPSLVARSVWQDIYIATRENPERCFQTFVELFMYKLVSDYRLIPSNLRLSQLVGSSEMFLHSMGQTQIEFYFQQVRPLLKSHRFPPAMTQDLLPGLVSEVAHSYVSTKTLIPSIRAEGGETSIINGHAFDEQPQDYNSSFVRILSKLHLLPHIDRLDRTFKSRVYEQFLRRDPNATKVSGKYLTPRNVVKAIVNMARIWDLHRGAVICDPACGVGGFITESILELNRRGVSNYAEVDGRIAVERKFVGLEVQRDIVCLAKANMLIHCIEMYTELSEDAKMTFATDLLADVFVHTHEDRVLGSLMHPVSSEFDVIMANPPYVVAGTAAITEKIRRRGLSEYYAGGGTGLESRFVNWIVRALRPGGRGFIILPKSMLARVEGKLKRFVRDHAIVDALVYLPERTFYTTPSATYILAITKKHSPEVVQESPVLTYFVREIGETRDTERLPTRNDLVHMVADFVVFMANKGNFEASTSFCKVLPITALDPANRWDVDYLWSPKELAALGVVDTNVRSVDGVVTELEQITAELTQTEEKLRQLFVDVDDYMELHLSNTRYFRIHRGKRVTKSQCRQFPGDVPVVASGRHESSYLGTISEEYVVREGLRMFGSSTKMVTIGATGAVGTVNRRREDRWLLHDDALALEILDGDIIPRYFRYELQRVIDRARFDYTAKLYRERLAALVVTVPLGRDGTFDVDRQEQIADMYREKENMERMLRALSERFRSVSLDVARG